MLEHAWHWFCALPFWAQTLAYFGGSGSVLLGVCLRIAKRGALVFAKEWVESEGGRVTTDDEHTARHRLPSGQNERLPSAPEMDSSLSDHWRKRFSDGQRDRLALQEAFDLAIVQNGVLEGELREARATVADVGRIQVALTASRRREDALRDEVDVLRTSMGQRPKYRQHPAPRTPGSEPALEPVTDPPPGLEGETPKMGFRRKTPPEET